MNNCSYLFVHIKKELLLKFFFKYRVVHLSSNIIFERYLGSWLKSGRPEAHRLACLPLLPSEPDGVHKRLLHRARFSTLLAKVRPQRLYPRSGIQPCYSGLQVQGTANSPSSTTNGYMLNV